MSSVSTFILKFPIAIAPEQILHLRHTLITCAFKEQLFLAKHYLHPDLFSNETPDGISYDRYPLIQYKIIDGHAAALGIHSGAKALSLLWEKWEDQPLFQSTQILTAEGASAKWKTRLIKQAGKKRTYQLLQWLPCNKRDATTYFESPDRVLFLKEKLIQHISKLSIDLELGINDVDIYDLSVLKEERKSFKSRQIRPFIDCRFTTNIRLPKYIGLGNSPAFGFGTLLPVKTKKL